MRRRTPWGGALERFPRSIFLLFFASPLARFAGSLVFR
jgi:hypothetical protein